MNENGLSAADVAAVTGGNGNRGGFGGDWGSMLWLFAILALMGGWGGGFGGGFGGGNMALGYDFPWILNGQNGINSNTNSGFRDAMLNDSINSIRDGIGSLSTQLCGCSGDMQMALANGFAGVEQGANTRQIANMQQAFAAQTAMNQGFNGIQGQLAQCCCDNRLATANLQSVIQTENCADRYEAAQNTMNIINNQNQGVQRILDQMCQDKIDEKNDIIAQLRQEVLYARGQASQDVQTARLLAGQTSEVDALYNRLAQCPVPCMPVYGMTPIFSCNGNNGCGCNGGINL